MNAELHRLLFEESTVSRTWLELFRTAIKQTKPDYSNLIADIAREYECDPSARDGFSRLAYYCMRQHDYPTALRLFERDASYGRQTWWQQLRHAECLARVNRLDQAISIVESVYEDNPDASNGFAAIAEALTVVQPGKQALLLLKRDIDSTRLTPGYMLNAAVLLYKASRKNNATNLVHNAYNHDPSLKDGFARLGHIAAKNNITEGMSLFETDLKLGRLSILHAKQWVRIITAVQPIDKAMLSRVVKDMYSRYPETTDLLAERAWELTSSQEMSATTQILLDIENHHGQFSAESRLQYAAFLLLSGKDLVAEEQIKQAFHEDPDLPNGITQMLRISPPRQAYAVLNQYRQDHLHGKTGASSLSDCAILLAKLGDLDAAADTIQYIYNHDTNSRDGYTRIADAYFSPQKMFHSIRPFLERDHEAGRSSIFSKFTHIKLSAINGHIKDAIDQAAHLYKTDKKTNGALSHAAVQLMQLWRYDQALVLLEAETRPTPHHDLFATHCRWLKSHTDHAIQQFPDDDQATLRKQLTEIRGAGPDTNSINVLNSRLGIASQFDSLHLFHEIILFQPYFFKTTNPIPTIIDGGSNCGFALAYFKYLYPNARIKAFEPNPDLGNLLKRSIEVNNWSDISLHACAIAANEGKPIDLHIPNGNIMGSSTLNDFVRSTKAVRAVSVPTTPLTSLLTQPVDFLKLDIEGAEAQVLMDVGDSLKQVKQGFIEYHYRSAQLDENRLSDVLRALELNNMKYTIPPPIERIPAIQSDPLQPALTRWSCSIHFAQRSP